MKINYQTPTASLGRQNVEQPLQKGREEAALIGQVADISVGIYDAVQEQRGLRMFADAQKEMHDYEIELENNPASSQEELDDNLKTKMSLLRDRANEELSSQAQKTFYSKFTPKEEALRFGMMGLNASRLADQERKDTQTSLKALAEVDLQGSLEQLQESPLYSDAEKSEGAADLIKINHQAVVADALYSKDATKIQGAIDQLEKGDTPLSETERRRNISYLNTALDNANAERTAAILKAKELAASDLEIAVFDGQKGPVEIQDAFDKDVITGAKRTQLLKMWRKDKEDGTSKADRQSKLAYVLANDLGLDPQDKDDILSVNEAYEDGKKSIDDQGPLQPQERAALQKQLSDVAINVAKRTNILPKQMAADLRIFGFTGNPQEVLRQGEIYKALRDSAPNVIDGVAPDTKAVYESMSAMVAGGTDPAEALKVSRENAKAPKEVKAQYREQYKATGSSTDRVNDLLEADDAFDLDILGYPEVNAQQAASYRAMEYQYYINMGGDIELATKAAKNDFKRIYGGTRLAGKGVQVMPYAPEQYYPMFNEDELKASMTGAASVSNPDTVFIQSDAVTAREKNKSYVLFHENEFGLPTPVLKADGTLAARWIPDVSKISKARRAELDVDIAKAKAIRDERRQSIEKRALKRRSRFAKGEEIINSRKRKYKYTPGL